MSNRILAFIAILVSATGATLGLAAQQTAAEKYVARLSMNKNAWLIAANTDSVAKLIDRRCLYIHSNGWVQQAYEIISDLRSGKMVYEKVDISETTARQFESMVIITGKGQFEGKVSGKPFNLKLAFTEVYVRRVDGWKLVSRHSNKIE
ncbi:MAG: nuclear transport factor 2 family protein [Chitinophagaceae bacterium]|jgi:hypothetical protein|nr:nuclear transport factor 2 family protein [Chitinophagaceae bacterium]